MVEFFKDESKYCDSFRLLLLFSNETSRLDAWLSTVVDSLVIFGIAKDLLLLFFNNGDIEDESFFVINFVVVSITPTGLLVLASIIILLNYILIKSFKK